LTNFERIKQHSSPIELTTRTLIQDDNLNTKELLDEALDDEFKVKSDTVTFASCSSTLEKLEEIIEKTTSTEELFVQDPFASHFQDAFGDLQTPVHDFTYDFDDAFAAVDTFEAEPHNFGVRSTLESPFNDTFDHQLDLDDQREVVDEVIDTNDAKEFGDKIKPLEEDTTKEIHHFEANFEDNFGNLDTSKVTIVDQLEVDFEASEDPNDKTEKTPFRHLEFSNPVKPIPDDLIKSGDNEDNEFEVICDPDKIEDNETGAPTIIEKATCID
jgi:hypothetical protein